MTSVASTPPSFHRVASPDTLAELDFERVLALVAAHAVGDLGARAVRSRRPGADVLAVREAIATVAELMRVLAEGDGLSPRAVPDIGETLGALAMPGSVLEGSALRMLADAVGAMRDVATQLRSLASDAPRVAALLVETPGADLAAAIEKALEPDGRVKDDASPGLRKARRHVRETRARLVASLEALLRQLPANAASDGAVTLKGGRYVIPVRREGRAALRGIVHGESGSGATLFVEPVEAVELGNALQEAEAEEQREELAVLRGLTDRARPETDRIGDGWSMCVAVDDLYARARYAGAVDAVPPVVEDPDGPIGLRGGRHPELVADGRGAVPFDLDLSDGRTVIVSGPNAGGKTVLLKAVGLFACMTQSGIVPPVGAGTRLPVFTDVLSDIGDRQSIAASLSTFSAHVARLKHVLDTAAARSLVLLDEVGGGTDPVEGAALAAGVLLELNRRGTVTVATTHLSQLKDLAARTAGVVNASLAFDGDTLSPTYRFEIGRPGRSYGLAIARRLGLPAGVLAEADALTPEEARSLEAALAEVERRETRLRELELENETRKAQLARDQAAAAERAETLARQAAELDERVRELERSGREQARRFLLEARRRVEDALGMARAAVSEATSKEARRLVEEGVREEADALKRLEDEAAAKGWRVRGREPKAPPRSGTGSGTRASAGGSVAAMPDLEAVASEIDVRGLRADEAEQRVLAAVDAAVVADLPFLRIIHGKGTGALRALVGDVLRADRRVAGARLAPPEQGGTGVTMVEFRR